MTSRLATCPLTISAGYFCDPLQLLQTFPPFTPPVQLLQALPPDPAHREHTTFEMSETLGRVIAAPIQTTALATMSLTQLRLSRFNIVNLHTAV